MWQLKRTRQCDKCPWRTATNPREIPNGYSVDKHCALAGTIATPGDLSQITAPTIRVMACHETHNTMCLGWLMHQLGPGNNIPLRIHVRDCRNIDKVKLRGPQHDRFEDTLP